MRSSATTVERTSAPVGVIFAVVLHAAVIAATLFTWSHATLDIDDQAAPIVPVDLVTLGAKTDIAPMVKQQPKEPPKQEDIQPPAPDTAQPAQAAPQEDTAPPPPDESPAPALAKPVPPVIPKTKPQPDQKKEKFDPDNILALLDKRAATASSAPIAKTGPRNIKGYGAQNAMTMDLVDALRNQITQCWTNPPIGAPDPAKLIVTFRLFLNSDGSIAQPPQFSGSSASATDDPYVRAAAEAARRAIYTCAPYRLPADRYDQWRDITFTFDPRRMMGQ